jgi:carbamoyltransferase
MTYNIMAVTPGHNGSVALLVDGELVYYLEEERLSRMKYDGNPFKGMLDIMKDYHIDEIVIAGTSSELPSLPWTGEDPYTSLVRKFNPNVKSTRLGHEHHLGHAACAFYNSGFEQAVAVIVDGAGSFQTHQLNEDGFTAKGFETESIFTCEYPAKFQPVFKSYGDNESPRIFTGNMLFDSAVSVTKAYEGVSHYLGFGFIEAGKTMGLAPYGKTDPKIPPLFINGRGTKDIFNPVYPSGSLIEQSRYDIFKKENDSNEWHTDPEKLRDIDKNLAFAIQRDTQDLVLNLILSAVESTGIKNVVLAGGYGLNCVANYHFRKRLPHDVKLYCEPIAHDGGTVVGVAKLIHYNNTESTEISPQTSIYLGPQYDTSSYLNTIEDFDFKVSDVTYEDIAKLIADKNIVAMFQGRSEAGPRALGNRSILYDPRDPDGKDEVNKVKGREWFRPFAGTVLVEDADDWFDMAGMKESPFMMYAVNVAADKLKDIPAITHVDDTCRVQTVSEEQNLHYYNLIKAFKSITEVPVMFNTSFNLAGDPLVETIDDALVTIDRSDIKYLYLPEIGKLITKS